LCGSGIPFPEFGNWNRINFLVAESALMAKKSWISFSTLVLLAYVLLRVAFLYPRWELGGSIAVLSWDVFGYYLYLPAQFIYHDLEGLAFVPDIVATYQNPSPAMGHAILLPDGNHVMTYPMGMALLYAPFFFLAHLLAPGMGFPADGFSLPYQLGIAMGGILYAWLGLWLLRRLLLRYFEDLTVALTLAAIAIGTHYLNYATADNAMPHIYLFALYAALILLTVDWHDRPRVGIAAALGALIGLATITRPTELISLLVPLLWGVSSRETLRQKIQTLRRHPGHVAALALAMIAVGSLQLFYWKSVSGHFFFYSYGDDKGFSFLHPHIIDCLFSYRKGWLVYTPMMLFALLGFVPLYRRNKSLFLPVLAFCLVNMYVVFSWDIWWYGGGFGQRALIQSYPLLALPLAACIGWMRKNKIAAIAGFTMMFLFTDLNLIQTWQIHTSGGGLRTDYMNGAYYWKVFATTRARQSDLKYLDARRELSSTHNRTVSSLLEEGFETDTAAWRSSEHVFSGQYAAKAAIDHPRIPLYEVSLRETGHAPDTWFRIQSQLFYESHGGDEEKMARLVAVFVRHETGEEYGRVGVKLQRLDGNWHWYALQFDHRMPRDAQPDDRFRLYLENPEPAHPIWIDAVNLTLISPKR
jgi:hypothetical protein